MASIMGWRAKLWRQAEDEVRPVIKKYLAAGTVLFRAGEPCPGVALIHEGAVALLATDGGTERQIERRGRGAYVGDDAVLRTGICRHTVVALCQTTVEMLDRDVFLERSAIQQRDHTTAPSSPAEHSASAARVVVRLAAASAECLAVMPVGGIEITAYPFVVGRAPSGPSDAFDRQGGLLLDERPPYRLSRRQFAIVESEMGIGLADPGSRLGTFVGGERLGMAPLFLEPGRMIEIVAGGAQSPFRFHLSASQ